MKKSFLTILFTIIMILSVSTMAVGVDNCEGNCTHQAAIGQVHYETLKDAMNAAKGGETVLMLTDVDLKNEEWEPVSFAGKFNGQNHTISNLTINKPGSSNIGFITSLNGTFENVTFTNVDVTGGENTGVVAGRAGGGAALAQNITVNGTIKVETTHSGYARAGVIVGGWGYGNYKDITVDGTDAEISYIKHTGGGDGRYVAGIVGHADDVASYVNCTVKNITIAGGWLCGGIAGPGPSDGLVSGCSVENIKIGASYSGGIFGWYYGDGSITDSSVKNVEFTAGSSNNGAIGGYEIPDGVTVRNVTIENVTNSGSGELLSYAAMVNDGTNITYHTTLAAAFKAATSGATIEILRDVTVSEDWDCRYTGARFTVPVTIEGNGHTLKFTGNIDDKNWNTVFRFEENATVKDLTIDVSEANSVQRGISSRLGIIIENCTFRGNGTTSKRAVIFGEGARSAIEDVEVVITDSAFINWSYGVTDNQNAQDAKSVSITDNTFTNASVLVSAYEEISFTGNTMENAWVNITSYTSSETLQVNAVGNTLEDNTATKSNEISVALNAEVIADPEFDIVMEDENGTEYYEVTFDIPANATVEVRDALGNICEPVNGVYVLENGTYTYTVNQRYCDPEKGSFTVNGATQTITVESLSETVYYEILIPKMYNITIKDSIGGKVTGSRTAAAGTTVKLTVTPDEGYELADLLVNAGRRKISVSEKNGTYSFNIPYAHVTVTAVFEKIAEEAAAEEVPAVWANPYSDVSADAWYYGDIEFVTESGLMIGTSEDGTAFSPAEAVNRAMLVTTLWRLEGSPEAASADFTDVPADEWYTAAVDWAAANGIVLGYGDGVFGAMDDLTHEQIMAILNRYAVYNQWSEVVTGSADDTYTNSDWAEENVLWADESGMFDGIESDITNLTEGADRAELAAYLRRFCEKFIA